MPTGALRLTETAPGKLGMKTNDPSKLPLTYVQVASASDAAKNAPMSSMNRR